MNDYDPRAAIKIGGEYPLHSLYPGYVVLIDGREALITAYGYTWVTVNYKDDWRNAYPDGRITVKVIGDYGVPTGNVAHWPDSELQGEQTR